MPNYEVLSSAQVLILSTPISWWLNLQELFLGDFNQILFGNPNKRYSRVSVFSRTQSKQTLTDRSNNLSFTSDYMWTWSSHQCLWSSVSSSVKGGSGWIIGGILSVIILLVLPFIEAIMPVPNVWCASVFGELPLYFRFQQLVWQGNQTCWYEAPLWNSPPDAVSSILLLNSYAVSSYYEPIQ